MKWKRNPVASLAALASCFVLFFAYRPASAGQEVAVDTIKDLAESVLVAVVEVKSVTRVDIDEIHGPLKTKTAVFVAQAEVITTIKTDHFPAPEKRTITIVSSTRPSTSAVWRPIEKGRYLAFLKRDRAHYDFKYNMSFQKIVEGEEIRWGEYKLNRFVETKVNVDKAIKRLQAAVPKKTKP
ncbi:MAG: hypothetical protein AAF483_14415 [Planctomycetota bacterium]